jgi:hypothetical protein
MILSPHGEIKRDFPSFPLLSHQFDIGGQEMTDTINPDLETVKKALKANQFTHVECVENGVRAAALVLDIIPRTAQVGLGGSTSVRQLGILELLRQRGTPIINDAESDTVPFADLMRRTLLSDVLLASSNAVTLDGKLVNIDGMGNRVGGIVFGPKKVILIIGRNKIVADVDRAIERLRNVIAPFHANAYGAKLPCAATGYCVDCNSSERICRVTTIIEKRPSAADVSILLVDEDLGLGWDPAWSEDRKVRIASMYRDTRKKYYPAGRKLGSEKPLSSK